MADQQKPLCQYGVKCYRKNPAHLADYRHPHADDNNEEPMQQATSEEAGAAKIPESTATAARRAHSTDDADTDPDQPERKRNAAAATTTTEETASAAPVTPQKEQQCFDSDTDQALRAEYDRLILDRPAFILNKFLVSMPDDFYRFWDFCTTLNAANPAAALQRFNLALVGPFDVLAGRFDTLAPREPAEYLRHWRFFYDPPEFQTVLVCTGKRDGLHYGYWRDEPQDGGNVLVAQTDVDQGCEVRLVAENLFAVVLHHLDKEVKLTPFDKPAADALRHKLQKFAAQSPGFRLDGLSGRLRERNLTVVARTFHTAGLVVPVDRQSDVGYRPMLETPAVLRKMLQRLDDPEDGEADVVVGLVMEKVQPLVTAANIAVDESDFGTAIELGLNFFCHGSMRLHGLAMQLLATGYAMVQRPQLIAIVKAHLSQRKRTKDVSIL